MTSPLLDAFLRDYVLPRAAELRRGFELVLDRTVKGPAGLRRELATLRRQKRRLARAVAEGLPPGRAARRGRATERA